VLAVLLAFSTANAQQGTTGKPATSAANSAAVNPTGAAVKAFQDRVAAWTAFRNQVDNGIPKLAETSNPMQIAERERALGEALIKARTAPAQGEYFVKEVQPVFAKMISQDFKKRTAAERKALTLELPKGVRFDINMIYPSSVPLATFPANLLKVLPDLPKELEYRIVHRHLILRDVAGNYVVDMIPNIFPIPM
jgi:hypothetical protein